MTNKINDRTETRVRMGKIIKEARTKKGLTQSDLGKMLGKSNNAITNWEKGTNSPDVDSIELLCSILGIPVNYMFKPRENEKSPSIEFSIEEQKLITSYRKLSHDNQMKVIGMIEIKIDEEAATRDSYVSQTKRA